MNDICIIKDAKILIVDDDPITIRNAVRILKEDYKVSYATGGEAALELIKKSVPDLILLDLHMPGMNGFDVLKKLKESSEYKDIPVIFLTADSDRETEVKGLKAGAHDFVAKPFMDEIVKQRVAHLLELSILQRNLKEEVARQTARAEERREQMEEMSFQTVQALAGAIDAKDKYTKGHSARVSEYSVALARELGWNKAKTDKLRYASLLHDVGKIGIPDLVLNKMGKLSDVEFNIIKSHTTIGGEILRNITTVEDAVDVARHHHERFDGGGYPDRLKGEEIPVMARIVGIADAFDAMNSKRIYRNALPWSVVREELVRGRGTQFDPKMLDVFLQMFDRGDFDDKDRIVQDSINENANIIKRLIESAYDSGASSQIDELTGLMLRGGGEGRIKELMLTGPGYLAMLDLDNLKKLNDLYGHKQGDLLLKILGDIIQNDENIDVSCRVGGDEFLLYFNEKSLDEVALIISCIQKNFAEIKNGNACFEYNSLSCGVCPTWPIDSFEDAYSNADKALYFAKRNGKNRVHFFERERDYEISKTDVDFEALVKSFKTAGEYTGALQVDYREFTQLYEYVKNMQNRYSHDIQVVMVTLESKERQADIDKIGVSIRAMEEAIKNTVRTVDICTRYTNMQFLIILFGSKKEEVKLIMDRVFASYYKIADDINIVPSYKTSGIE